MYQTVFENLKSFNTPNKLKDAIRTFITSQCLTVNDTKELKKLFLEIDTNGDGKLSKEELLRYYVNLMGPDHSEEEAQKIMNEVDTDKNGFIDYSEFIKAAVNETLMTNAMYLKNAFEKFDEDSNGKISADELKKLLQDDSFQNDELWTDIIKQADQNSDGVIDFKEFTDLVLKSAINSTN